VDYLPSIELLEDTHEFPGIFVFKAIGRVENGFVARVVATIRDELEMDVDPPFSVRQTAHGRHVAVTIQPEIQSVYQVLAVYRRLQETDGLVMLL